MKRKIFLLCVCCMSLLLIGCGMSKKTIGEEGEAENKEEESSVSDTDYYKYINDKLLCEDTSPNSEITYGYNQLVSNQSMDITFSPDYEGYTWELLETRAAMGVMSGLVEDFDNDGCLELLVVRVIRVNMYDSFLRAVNYLETREYPYNPDDASTVLDISLYDYDGKEIYCRAKGDSCILPDWYMGSMLLGLEKIDDTYYVFARCQFQNIEYYGATMANYYTVTSLGDENIADLHIAYCSPLRLGYLDTYEQEEKMGIYNPLDISGTTLSDLKDVVFEISSAEEAYKELDEKLLCYVEFDITNPNGKLTYTATDYTKLSEHIESIE